MSQAKCLVCESVAEEDPSTTANNQREFYTNCPTCGMYRHDDFVRSKLNLNKEPNIYKISFVLRSEYERLRGKYRNSGMPAAEKTFIWERLHTLTTEDFTRMLATPDMSVMQKIGTLLHFLAQNSTFPGEKIPLMLVTDYPVCMARNEQEARQYVDSLESRRFVKKDVTLSTLDVTVTIEGWVEFERMEQAGGDSSNGFIAMWFDPSRGETDRAISRAITRAGYLPVRIDRVQHVNRIDDEIIARIRQSKFIVADFTGQRNGVYFEAGFMLGLGRTVIWVCEKNEMEKVHFDTRQYNTIDYGNPQDLEQRLVNRIEAILGAGPHKSN